MLDPRVIDPDQELVDTTGIDDAEMTQIVRVLAGMSRWRDAESALSARTRGGMRIGETDMERCAISSRRSTRGGSSRPVHWPSAYAEDAGSDRPVPEQAP
jgi:hypothetical protein